MILGQGQPLRLLQARKAQPQPNCRRWSPYAAQAPPSAAVAPGFQHLSEQCKAENIRWQEGSVPRTVKEAILRQRGCVLWFTGLSGAGKSTVAAALEHELARRRCLTALLDGDNVRHGLCSNLGFSADDREENIRRIGEVARLFVDCGIICITAFISPYREDRTRVRTRLAPGDFVEIHMKVPLHICEQRDCKGLYKLARAGKIRGFTGVDDPYEEPLSPEIALEPMAPDGTPNTPESMAAQVIAFLERFGYLAPPTGSGGGICNGATAV